MPPRNMREFETRGCEQQSYGAWKVWVGPRKRLDVSASFDIGGCRREGTHGQSRRRRRPTSTAAAFD